MSRNKIKQNMGVWIKNIFQGWSSARWLGSQQLHLRAQDGITTCDRKTQRSSFSGICCSSVSREWNLNLAAAAVTPAHTVTTGLGGRNLPRAFAFILRSCFEFGTQQIQRCSKHHKLFDFGMVICSINILFSRHRDSARMSKTQS